MSNRGGETRPLSVERGRYRLQQAILLLVGIDLIVSLYSMATLGFGRAPQQAGRLLITLLLCWALWRGARWSRWVVLTVVLLGLLVVSGAALSSLRREVNASSLFLLLMTLGYIAVGRILLWSKDVPAFMAAQRASRSGSDPAAGLTR
jgi:hypothetical protein